MPSASATAISRDSASASIMVPVGLAGLATTTPLQRLAPVLGDQRFRRQRPARLRRCLDQHRLAAERGQNVPIRRIAGIGQRHPVARLEQRQESQDESAGRAGRHHHACRIESEIVSILVMARDPRPQRRDAERFGVADAAMRKRGLRRLDRRRRRGRRRLADFHMDDAGAQRLALRRRRHHVHNDERRNIAAFGWLQELFCRLKHRFRPIGPRHPAPLLPYSPDCLRMAIHDPVVIAAALTAP